MIRRPPRSTRTDTLFPYTTLFRSTQAGTLCVHAKIFAKGEYHLAEPPFLHPPPDRWRCGPAAAQCPARHGRSLRALCRNPGRNRGGNDAGRRDGRSEEHTSELQSLMRISYAVFCLKKKNKKQQREYR